MSHRMMGHRMVGHRMVGHRMLMSFAENRFGRDLDDHYLSS